ncbi:mitochondrial carrier homolog 2 [Nilaparvata lugens]|uniref:mitochondrial carrier homolog 2 n=1 Tax=Nilaparvata lugens TaxID=108931 RepID=UPI00193E8E22|nr:mitochondrial carrier homolog 2 [Nilaparvata lugens]
MVSSYLIIFKDTLIWDIVTYPLEYASFLVQIGYRPENDIVSSNLFRRSFGVSSVTSTVGHIYKTDGLIGCYNGMRPYICSQFISKAIIQLYSDKFPPHGRWRKIDTISPSSVYEDDSSTRQTAVEWRPVCLQGAIDLLSQLTAITISHPLTIVTYRMMAQFVGREQKYTGVCSSLCTIYEEQGICGFFVGLAPQLMRQIISFVSLSAVLFILEKYTRSKPALCDFSSNLADVAIRNLTYPLHIVSVFTAANDFDLRAVSPPLMPDFNGDWTECWNYMSKTGQLKRAWFPFRRYSHTMPAKSIKISIDELD